MGSRKIIHVDMDAFFASVEQMDNPDLRGKPVAVGGGSSRGVVAAASYEARKYGVRSAMPGFKAKQKCPHLIFVPPRFKRYKELSAQIGEVFFEYTDLVEPLSLDEAYLDVTDNKPKIDSAIKIAKEIKQKIKNRIGLNASAGVSINKFLAKVASDLHKPDGLSVILPEDVQTFIDELPIEKFYGIGKSTALKMKTLGIATGKDLYEYSEIDLVNNFGKFGRYLFKVVRGNDDREVKAERVRKSISVERTFEEDLVEIKDVEEKIKLVNEKLVQSLVRTKIKGKTINLKIKFNDFTTITRSKSVKTYMQDPKVIKSICWELFEQIKWEGKGIRLLGLGLSNLDTEQNEQQLEFELS